MEVIKKKYEGNSEKVDFKALRKSVEQKNKIFKSKAVVLKDTEVKFKNKSNESSDPQI